MIGVIHGDTRSLHESSYKDCSGMYRDITPRIGEASGNTNE